ncbi:MAG: GTP-binding protein [Filomicrobium sp.]
MSPIPVTLLTGFLGAGKTTFLNDLLRDPQFKGTAVLINEFGEVSVDHDLVAGVEGDLVTTTTGCICCTASSDAKQALFDLWNRRKNREIEAFDRVIIETTGLADPAPVVASLLAPPSGNLMDRIVATQFALTRVVTMLDAVHGETTLDRYPEPPKQIALADIVVVSKSDLATDPASQTDLKRLITNVRTLNPTAKVLDRKEDWQGILEVLLENGTYDLRTKGEDALAWLSAEEVLLQPGGHHHQHHDHHHEHDHHHHEHEAGHDHDHSHDPNRHHSGIGAHAITIDEPLEQSSFYLFLQALRVAAGPDLLRLKGLFKLADDPTRPVVVHGVQSQIHEIERLDEWPSENQNTRIVFIGQNLDVEKFRSLLRQC